MSVNSPPGGARGGHDRGGDPRGAVRPGVGCGALGGVRQCGYGRPVLGQIQSEEGGPQGGGQGGWVQP
eukprot:4052235-Pyramimonas_sp.AAC.1